MTQIIDLNRQNGKNFQDEISQVQKWDVFLPPKDVGPCEREGQHNQSKPKAIRAAEPRPPICHDALLPAAASAGGCSKQPAGWRGHDPRHPAGSRRVRQAGRQPPTAAARDLRGRRGRLAAEAQCGAERSSPEDPRLLVTQQK